MTFVKFPATTCPHCKSVGAENLYHLGDRAYLCCLTCEGEYSILLPTLYAERRTKYGLEMEAHYGEQVID